MVVRPECLKLHSCAKFDTGDSNQITRDVWNLKWEVFAYKTGHPYSLLGS